EGQLRNIMIVSSRKLGVKTNAMFDVIIVQLHADKKVGGKSYGYGHRVHDLAGSRQGVPVVLFGELCRNSIATLGLLQDLPKSLREFIHLALRHDKSRQQPQHAFMRAINNQSFAQRAFYINLDLDSKLDSQYQSFV